MCPMSPAAGEHVQFYHFILHILYIKRIGVLNSHTLTKDSKFRDTIFLVSTRKEKDAIISFAGKMWAEENNRPMYWWYKRPVSFKGCSEDADDIAQSMH